MSDADDRALANLGNRTDAMRTITNILIDGGFTRSEIVGMLATLLAHALHEGVQPDRREILLAQTTAMVRTVWHDLDGRDGGRRPGP